MRIDLWKTLSIASSAGLVGILSLGHAFGQAPANAPPTIPPSSTPPALGQKVDWFRAGDLGVLPKRIRQDLPLSDQKNTGGWTLDRSVSDEFRGPGLDPKKWHLLPNAPDDWKGREPALFYPPNVTVTGGQMHLAFRKENVPAMAGLKGFQDYTSCAVHTIERSGYGYYEARCECGDSAASSAFWLTDTGREDYKTEIDIFEIGAKSKDWAHKYNMTPHMWATPAGPNHWSRGATWDAPFDFGKTYHVFGFDWSKESMKWYVDGVLVRTAVNTDWFYPMQIMFDTEAMFDWFGKVNDNDLPASFNVDYLRVWRKKGEPGAGQ